MSAILTMTAATESLATGEKDLQVAARALSFVNGMPNGPVKTAVLYDPANAGSKADAEAIKAWIEANPMAGKSKLVPTLVAANDAAGLADAKAAFVAEGSDGQFAAIAAAAASGKIVTISADMDCVRGGHCAVGVASSPRVEILVSRTAAAASGASFASAFLMLIKEI